MMTVPTLSMRIQAPTHSLPDKELSPTKEVDHGEKRDFLHSVAEAGLFANLKVLTTISKAKWIRMYGTKYVSYKVCVLPVNAATFIPRAPVFGKLKSIWLANEHVALNMNHTGPRHSMNT